MNREQPIPGIDTHTKWPPKEALQRFEKRLNGITDTVESTLTTMTERIAQKDHAIEALTKNTVALSNEITTLKAENARLRNAHEILDNFAKSVQITAASLLEEGDDFMTANHWLGEANDAMEKANAALAAQKPQG